MISINPNFLTSEEINIILNYVKNESQNHWSIDENNQSRVLNLNYHKSLEPKDKLIFEMIIKIRIRIEQHITQTCGLAVPIYAECASVIRWPEGYGQEPHADSEQNDPEDGEHQYPHRFYAAVCYLNDDYEGGDLYFPQHGLELKPAPGVMIHFPGTREYLHGVHPVTNGVRYAITAFYTKDINKADGLPR